MLMGVLGLVGKAGEGLMSLNKDFVRFHEFGVDAVEGFLDFEPVIIVFDSGLFYILVGVSLDVLEFHLYLGLHLIAVDKIVLAECVLELFDVGIHSLPVRAELIIDNLVDDRNDMGVLFWVLDPLGHVFSVVVHFVYELVILIEFLVEGLYDFLFLLEFVSQVVYFGFDVRLDHAADLL